MPAVQALDAQLDLYPGDPRQRLRRAYLNMTSGKSFRKNELKLLTFVGVTGESMHELRLGAARADGLVRCPDLMDRKSRGQLSYYEADAAELHGYPKVRLDPLWRIIAGVPHSVAVAVESSVR